LGAPICRASIARSSSKKAVETLLGAGLAAAALGLRQEAELVGIGLTAPQPFGDAILLDRRQYRRNAGLAQVFLR
jgi:hypothetical protein